MSSSEEERLDGVVGTEFASRTPVSLPTRSRMTVVTNGFLHFAPDARGQLDTAKGRLVDPPGSESS